MKNQQKIKKENTINRSCKENRTTAGETKKIKQIIYFQHQQKKEG